MSTKSFSNAQESRIAKYLGWNRVCASGARDFRPGDIESSDWLGECKTHTTPCHNIIFNQTVWNKISSEAIAVKRYPVLFADDGSQTIAKTWCMFSLNAISDRNIITRKYPFSIRTNIVFSSDKLSSDLHQTRLNEDINSIIVYQVPDGRGIIRLSDFADII